MANTGTIHLEVCAPEKPLIEVDATEVIVPGEQGLFTVLPGHTPFLSTLRTGAVVAYNGDDEPHFFAVHGGFAEVLDDRVVILARAFEHAEEIDLDRAEAAKERAKERLQTRAEDIDYARAEAALERACARLHAHHRSEY